MKSVRQWLKNPLQYWRHEEWQRVISFPNRPHSIGFNYRHAFGARWSIRLERNYWSSIFIGSICNNIRPYLALDHRRFLADPDVKELIKFLLWILFSPFTPGALPVRRKFALDHDTFRGKEPSEYYSTIYFDSLRIYTGECILLVHPLLLRKASKIWKRGKLILRKQGFMGNLGASFMVITQIMEGERRWKDWF